MKRDMDLFRALLLSIEEANSPELRKTPEIPPHTHGEIVEHVRLGIEAGMIDAIDASTLAARNYIQIRLTWHGHEFAEKVRDPQIWHQTKAGATKVGTWSIGLLGELATGYVKAKAASLGLPLG